MAQRNPSDFDARLAEVDQQAESQSGGFEIVETLRHM
jgi:hypothetical protein